jgi:gas vesicle protein
MKKESQVKNVGKAVAVGAGIAALSAAAYVLFGPEGKKNRKVIRGWAIKMKGEVIEKLENAKEISEPIYHDIVNKVSEKYAKVKNVNPEELTKAVEDLRKQWKNMVRDAKPKKKVAKKAPAQK